MREHPPRREARVRRRRHQDANHRLHRSHPQGVAARHRRRHFAVGRGGRRARSPKTRPIRCFPTPSTRPMGAFSCHPPPRARSGPTTSSRPMCGLGHRAGKAHPVGFRCILADAPIRDAEYSSVTPGYRRVINGGKGGVLPLTCFRQDQADGRNAWSDAARRVGMPESQFRANYTRKTSWVVSAFDTAGKNTALVYNGRLLFTRCNPAGLLLRLRHRLAGHAELLRAAHRLPLRQEGHVQREREH